MKFPLIALLLAALCGCSYQYTRQLTDTAVDHSGWRDSHQITRMRSLTLFPDSRIYVPVIATPLVDSDMQKALSASLRERLGYFFPRVTGSRQVMSVEAALARARQNGSGFVIAPQWIRFADRASSWAELDDSFAPLESVGFDRAWIQVSVWDVSSGELVDSTFIQSRSPVIQFRTYTPRTLLAGTFDAYLEKIVAVH